MPLIAICSIDRFGSTYPLVFALVYSETQDFYSWVLQQLSQVLVVFTSNAQASVVYMAHFKNIRNKFQKDVDIDEFTKVVQKLVYSDLQKNQIEQELKLLWNQFPNAKVYMCETWIPHKTSWLAPYTKCNINLDIRSSQRVEKFTQKQAYETFIHQNKYTHDGTDTGLEKLRLVYSRFAFITFIKPQEELAKSNIYKIFETPVHAYTHDELELHAGILFAFSNLIQQVSEYITEYGEMPKLSQRDQINTKAIFETINIKNTASYDKIQMPEIKHSCKIFYQTKIKKNDFIALKTTSISNMVNNDKVKILPIKHGRPPKSTIGQSSNSVVKSYLPE
ncbi:9107_t:CDS:2, partial [Dentiscutata erythropus]